jgi:AAA domain
MRRFIITGAPGAGKTAIIRQLEFDGFSIVEEAATDIIAAAQSRAQPNPGLTDPSFIDVIADLQKHLVDRITSGGLNECWDKIACIDEESVSGCGVGWLVSHSRHWRDDLSDISYQKHLCREPLLWIHSVP